MKKIMTLILMTTLFVSCSKDNPDDGKRPSTFPQLKGTYIHLTDFFATRLTFTDQNILTESVNIWKQSLNRWESYSVQSKQWEVSGSTFQMRYWDYSHTLKEAFYGEWETMTFEFIDSDNFKLDDKLYTKE